MIFESSAHLPLSVAVGPAVNPISVVGRRRTGKRSRLLMAALKSLECRVHLSAYTFNSLASFSGANGSAPFGALVVDSHGNLYGTTANGGASNKGALFEVAKGTN